MKLQREIKESTITVGNFNTPLSETDRPGRQKTSEDRVELSNVINQLDLTDIYRPLYPTTAGYTFSSSSHRMLTEIDPILNHKTHFNKFDRRDIIQCLPSDHNEIK